MMASAICPPQFGNGYDATAVQDRYIRGIHWTPRTRPRRGRLSHRYRGRHRFGRCCCLLLRPKNKNEGEGGRNGCAHSLNEYGPNFNHRGGLAGATWGTTTPAFPIQLSAYPVMTRRCARYGYATATAGSSAAGFDTGQQTF